MAVDHNMPGLSNTWWDLLHKIAANLNWTYAALWSLTGDGRNLIWKQGYCNDPANGELFYSLYSKCIFTPGVGFAGHALSHKTNSILWLTGDELKRLEHPVADQTCFLKAAGIQTVVCLPLGLPSSSFVLELGTVSRVRETDDLANNIKKHLLHLLANGLPNLMKDNAIARPVMTAAAGQSSAQMRLPNPNRSPSSSLGMASETRIMEPPIFNSLNLDSPSSVGRGIFLKAQRQVESNIYSQLMQPVEPFGMQVGRLGGILNVVPPQLSVEVPELPGSPERSPCSGRPLSPSWTTETALLQMELNAFQSWTSMSEATTTLDAELHGMPGSTSSATTSRLAGEIVEDEIEQMLPGFSTTLDQFMADQQQQNLMGPGASWRGSSSRSSPVSLRSQTVEDTAISSAILERYADCHISELENDPRSRVQGNPVVSTGAATVHVPGESENYWRGEAQRISGPSSKETSPESNLSRPHPARPGYGIHPRISLATTSSQKQQEQLLPSKHQRGGSASPSAGTSQEQRLERLERQHSSTLQQQSQQQREDLKPGPSEVADSTPRLVQFGNVLQLGNAAGQVIEALPQEHDEAAVIHMLAERRRRNRQNENFSQLKSLIPAAPKMDKASVLAATIAYIHELKERVKDLERNNENLKSQLLGQEQDLSSSEGPLISTKAKGSPTRVRVRSPKSLSPTDLDKIQASPDGDGNLKIEIRHPCSQPDTTGYIFACLKELHFKVINANVAINDNRIHASFIVKMKRKNSAGQSAVCAEVEQALTICLSNLA